MRKLTTITLAEAELLADRIIELATRAGTPVAVCVMDLEYRVVVSKLMDGVPREYGEVAAQKADSALRIGDDTEVMTNPDSWSARDIVVMAARGRAVFKGGILIDDNRGDQICALAVSALSEDDDQALVEAAEAAVTIVNGQLTLTPLPDLTNQ